MTEPGAPTVARKVTGAALWTYGGLFGDRALRFVVFLVVARVAPPGQFGAVLISLLAVETLQALLNVGLPTALLQEAEVSADTLDSVFAVNLILSALTTAILFLSAGPLAGMMKTPAAAGLLRLLAMTPMINGLGAVHVSLIQRDLGFKTLAGRQALSSLAASAAAIGLAVAGYGLWALIVRAVVTAAGGTAMAWRSCAYRPRLRFEASSLRSVAPSGARLWAASLAGLINMRGFDLFAGVVLGAASLAALRIAGQTVMFLMEMTVGPLTALGYALLGRARGDRAQFEQTFVTLAHLAALMIFPAFAGLYVVADLLLPLMFGGRWAPAAAVTPYMCAIAPALYSQVMVSIGLFASGRSDRLLRWALIEAAVTMGFGLAGAPFGLVGLAVAGTLRLYLMAPLSWFWLKRDVGVAPGVLLWPAAPCVAASLLMAGVVYLVRMQGLPTMSHAATLAALVAVGFGVYVLMLPFTATVVWRRLFDRPPASQPVAAS